MPGLRGLSRDGSTDGPTRGGSTGGGSTRQSRNGRKPARELRAAEQRNRPWASRLLHRLDMASASSAAALTAALVSLAFLVAALLARRSTPWLTAFEALAAAVTLVMVFALQHTQSRQQAALQRKLDEILRVLPGTDERLVHLESAPEKDLVAVDLEHVQLRDDALTAE